jgi:membrane protease YdiL (CAAX protease family)
MVRREASTNRLYQLSLARPVLVPLALLAIAVFLRVVDIMVLPLAERWGEAFLHKALGFVLVLAYLWAVGQSVAAIGLHGRRVGEAMLIGSVGTVLIYVLGFGLQWLVSRAAGKQPALVVAATDPKTGLAKPGVTFALWLLLGNVVNSSMEEGLFRGVMLSHFRVRLSPWQANVLQAVLFGLWHLAWPIRHLVAGRIDLAAAVSQSVIIVLGATVSGLAWGYLFLKTDNLWASWTAHTINNSTLNLLHIRTVDGLDAATAVLYPVMTVGLVALMLWTRLWAERLQMPELEPWGSGGKASQSD